MNDDRHPPLSLSMSAAVAVTVLTLAAIAWALLRLPT